jgi:hypothetical protein
MILCLLLSLSNGILSICAGSILLVKVRGRVAFGGVDGARGARAWPLRVRRGHGGGEGVGSRCRQVAAASRSGTGTNSQQRVSTCLSRHRSKSQVMRDWVARGLSYGELMDGLVWPDLTCRE